ncbi:MAG: zinc metalloprotease HtpX [Desulfuromonadales bacterium]|nr:zinc metalloprotease HtpX [Desulfuromonadales bacterium]
MNTLRTTLLLGLLTVLLVIAGGAIGSRTSMGAHGGMTFALIISIVMNMGSYWFSDKIVLAMYKAREVTEEQYPELYSIVKELAQNGGIPMPRVYIVESDTPNAFATGRNPQHAAVAATTGILRILSRDELKGVMAHELSHVRHRDILISSIAATVAGAITYLAFIARWAAIFGGRGSRDNNGGAIGLIAMAILAPIAAMMVQMAISRSREYEADKGGAKLSGNPLYLANALKKLDMANKQIPMDANPSTAHMFIVNPLTAKGMASLFSTHPPTEERIKRLEEMK